MILFFENFVKLIHVANFTRVCLNVTFFDVIRFSKKTQLIFFCRILLITCLMFTSGQSAVFLLVLPVFIAPDVMMENNSKSRKADILLQTHERQRYILKTTGYCVLTKFFLLACFLLFKTESPQGIFLPNYLAWTLTRPFGDGDGDDGGGGDGVNLV